MEKVQWKVEGMDCNTCAINIHKYLEKQGMKNVKVNYATGDVIFEAVENFPEEKISAGISGLGYTVTGQRSVTGSTPRRPWLAGHGERFLFCLPFTLLLMLHMIPGLHHQPGWGWLFDHRVQLALTLPVYITGMIYFGESAWKSVRNRMPNMNVLITLGATAAFIYSLYGSLTGQAAQYMFYETTATIITLVFLGNYLEHRSIASTQRELNKLVKSQRVMAHMIAFDDEHKEQIFQVENTDLRTGDLILIRTGEQVPTDCKILWGEAHVNEAILTGETVPVHKKAKDNLIGGSVFTDGTVKAQVTATGDDTVLARIIQLVRQAQGEKPPMQVLADRISAVFIPLVLVIAALTLLINWWILGQFTPALLRSIAVLVIACPCAMGLATPAAIAVGLGRGARKGILFRNATSLELFKDIRQVVFDKTGTLTTGRFVIGSYRILDPAWDDTRFRQLVYSLEKYSAHPIATAVVRDWKMPGLLNWKKVEEIKGQGVFAEDREGNQFVAGSYKTAAALTEDAGHSVYVHSNGRLLGWIDLTDEIRPEAKGVVQWLKARGIRTWLLSGDRRERCETLAKELGIEQVLAEQTPEQKLQHLEQLTAEAPTAMVGDGINDAPALARATIGISLSEASQLAVQSAQVVLMNQGLRQLPLALGLGKHTYITIKQNLFWAFAYNVFAIPIAAVGLLSPTIGALAMGFSDVVLAINSVRLFVKKVS